MDKATFDRLTARLNDIERRLDEYCVDIPDWDQINEWTIYAGKQAAKTL